jgi:hypothetical protein
LTPAGIFSTKFATLKGTFLPRDPGDKRHQVSLAHYTDERSPSPDRVIAFLRNNSS